MEHPEILKDLTAMMTAALLTVYLLGKLRVPPMVGFLVAGVAIGPGALGLVSDPHDIEVIAEIGVALLLFSIGLKFSLTELVAMRELVLGVGVGQVVATVGVVVGIATTLGLAFPEGLFLGFLLALSSTAIVLKLLELRGETGSRHGRIVLAILILQDLTIIPMMLVTPALAGEGGSMAAVGMALVKALAMVVLLLVVTRRVFPWLLDRFVNLQSREVFTIGTLLLALGTAYAATLAGLSLALGAFLAGIVLADSDYSHQILAEITPFRDTFASLFFISVGMLADPRLMVQQPLLIVGLTAGAITLKALVAGGLVALFGFGGRVAVLSGIALAQVGEFSFILAQVGTDAGLFKESLYQPFLAVSVLAMAATPWLVGASHGIAEKIGDFIAARREVPGVSRHDQDLSDHVIIVGYGINGRNVARV
ncbi:MAG TPA: cation:proton antiporter, partial [bacterium]|nr:cation:proton antiporter [bacterium]